VMSFAPKISMKKSTGAEAQIFVGPQRPD